MKRFDNFLSILCGVQLFYIVVVLSLLSACSSIQEESSLPEKYHDHTCISTAEITWLYFTAVDRGELNVFGTILRREMLDPIRIEYIYELEGKPKSITSFKVYARLNKPLIPVAISELHIPKIHIVGASFNRAGEIFDTEVHVYHGQ